MYTQITATERYTIARLRQHGYTRAAIARLLGRHRSTISREVRRNATRHDGGYRSELADSYARTRRARSRRNQRFSPDSRGRLAGKRPITTRPAIVETRERIGDWEVDTIVGPEGNRHCIVSLVERKTGYLLLGTLRARTVAELNRRAIPLLRQQPHPVYTLTCDNGTEFHGYATLEAATAAQVYFATPHHAWERGTNENTNGLIRQYIPKRTSMAHLTQPQCTAIARQLNQRPRKRLGYRTPEECYA